MQILRAADYRIMPWKNGAGSTTEIAVSPDGAALDDFDWRISMAQVAADGAFSLFPGVDRTLLVLDGGGIVLTTAGHGVVRLDRDTAPYAFPGDRDTHATLIDGPIVDLNIMSRRGRVRQTVRRVDLATPRDFSGEATVTLIVVERGAAIARADCRDTELSERDCVVLDSADALEITPKPAARLVVIEFDT
jgi:uncharacterized protein